MRDYGLDGAPAAYSVTAAQGTVTEARYPLRVDGSAEGGFAATLTGDLCSSLPIAVGGLNDNWSAYLLDRGQARARPIGVFEQTAWATVPLHGTADLFVGHPVVCDQPDAKLLVSWMSPGKWFVEVHNPTDKPMTVKLNTNKGWTLFSHRATLTLAPGTSKVWEVKGK